MIAASIPLKVTSVANKRLHWAVKAKLTKAHRRTVAAFLGDTAPIPPKLPLTVVLTRIGPKKLDSDNLASAFKAVRDGVADWLGVDDGSDALDWQYRQRQDGPNVYLIELEVI